MRVVREWVLFLCCFAVCERQAVVCTGARYLITTKVEEVGTLGSWIHGQPDCVNTFGAIPT